MTPTQQLKEDHGAIKLLLEILEAIDQKLQRQEKVPAEDLENIVDFIRTFADKCHHGKEENLLFPAMEQAGMSKKDGPIAVMLKEHQLARRLVRGLDEAVDNYKKGDSQAIKKIMQNSRGYIELLSQHIDKEDDILYPIADEMLAREKQNELLKEFNRVEQEIIGQEKHQQYHQLLRELKEKYL